MDILTASRIAQNGQRISDPVQAQEIYQNLSNDANLRMKFLENHADILSGGVSFSGLSFAQDQEIESAKAEALKAQNEQIAKEYAQYVANKPKPDDFWGKPNDGNRGGF